MDRLATWPEQLLDRLYALGVGAPGQRVLDVGTGSGTLVRALAQRSCLVTGLDSSPAALDEALRLDELVGIDAEYVRAPVEQSGLPDKSFDIITAGQCWHLFDRPRAASECHRLLKARGRVAILHVDWVPVPGTIGEPTAELLAQQAPPRGPESRADDDPLHSRWIAELAAAGFHELETFSFDVHAPLSHADWCEHVRGRAAGRGGIRHGAAPPPEPAADPTPSADPAPADPRLERQMTTVLRDWPEQPLDVLLRAFAAVARKS